MERDKGSERGARQWRQTERLRGTQTSWDWNDETCCLSDCVCDAKCGDSERPRVTSVLVLTMLVMFTGSLRKDGARLHRSVVVVCACCVAVSSCCSCSRPREGVASVVSLSFHLRSHLVGPSFRYVPGGITARVVSVTVRSWRRC